MRTTLIFAVVIFIILLYPRYDLLVKEEFFDENFSVEKAGFWTHRGCHQAAFDMKARYYMCRNRTLMKEFIAYFESEETEQGANESGLYEQ